MANYSSLLVFAVFMAVATSLPRQGRGPPPWASGETSNRPQKPRHLPGAICLITQNGATRQFPCFPNNLLTCKPVQDLPESASSAGITELSLCLPISCNSRDDPVCYYADYRSQCTDASTADADDDLEGEAQELCPSIRDGGDSNEDDGGDSNEDDGGDSNEDNNDGARENTPEPTSTQSTTKETTTVSETSPTGTPPTRITRITRPTRVTPPPTTPTRQTFERLVLPQEGMQCTLSAEVRLAQRACRIKSNQRDTIRDCPPNADGSIPECNSSPDCQVTINQEPVDLYMCPKPKPGPGREPNGELPPGLGGFKPSWSQGQGRGSEGQVNRGQGGRSEDEGDSEEQENQGQGQENSQGQGNQGQGQGNSQGQGNQGQGQGNSRGQGNQGQGQGNSRGQGNSQGRGNQGQGQRNSGGRGRSRNPRNRGK